jgi:hypothetical protein
MKPVHDDSWDSIVQSPELQPSPIIRDELQTLVRQELEPSYLLLLFKVLGIHSVAAALSLLVCPQFGFHPLGLEFDPLAFLTSYGDAVCGLGCGVAFSLLTGLAARTFLSRDERRVSVRMGFWIFTPIMALSWALLMWAGLQNGHLHSASAVFSALWLAGAVLAAWAAVRGESTFAHP